MGGERNGRRRVKRLEGRACVVTGGAAGIGEAIVVRLVEEGARVAIADVDGARAHELAERLGGEGGEVLADRVDVSLPSEVAGFVDRAAREFGRLDGIVNNAGVAVPGSAENISEA